MKDFSCDDIFNNQSNHFPKEIKICPINKNNFINPNKDDISPNSIFKELKEKQEIQLNIINSKISILEKQFEDDIIYSKIKEIIKKYENYPSIKSLNILSNISLIPRPLFDANNDHILDIKSLTNSHSQNTSNENNNNIDLKNQEKNLSI